LKNKLVGNISDNKISYLLGNEETSLSRINSLSIKCPSRSGEVPRGFVGGTDLDLRLALLFKVMERGCFSFSVVISVGGEVSGGVSTSFSTETST
jgi:hypothetical protein